MLCPDFAGIFPSHATKVQIRMELWIVVKLFFSFASMVLCEAVGALSPCLHLLLPSPVMPWDIYWVKSTVPPALISLAVLEGVWYEISYSLRTVAGWCHKAVIFHKKVKMHFIF
jgi:hypothetical protein